MQREGGSNHGGSPSPAALTERGDIIYNIYNGTLIVARQWASDESPRMARRLPRRLARRSPVRAMAERLPTCRG